MARFQLSIACRGLIQPAAGEHCTVGIATISRLKQLNYKWLVAIVFMFGLCMDLLDSTSVNVAVPRLQSDFHAPLSSAEWAVTGYLLSLAMGVFVLGAALCGRAGSINELIAFRFVQGIGGGMMTPVSIAILSREFPGRSRPRRRR